MPLFTKLKELQLIYSLTHKPNLVKELSLPPAKDGQ